LINGITRRDGRRHSAVNVFSPTTSSKRED
jgi:hypothetical protein